jgi:hypothetical protein
LPDILYAPGRHHSRVAVPYDSLTIDESGNKIELPGASKDQLKQVAEFRYGS